MAVDSLIERRDLRWWAALVGLWIVATAVTALLAGGLATPIRYQDEFLFWALAKSIAAGEGLAWHGAPLPIVSSLYPFAIAPLLRASSNVSTQYELVKIANSAMICAVVFPTYAGARMIASKPLALLAASFALLVPALNYAGLIGTESLAYPVGAAALFALVSVLARPTGTRVTLAIVLLVVAVLTRVQFAALVPVAVLAALMFVALGGTGDRRAALRAIAPVAGALAVLIAIAGIYFLIRGRSAAGIYQSALRLEGITASDVFYWLRAYLADIWVVCGILPAIATFALMGDAKNRRDPAICALLAVVLAATIVFVLQMTWFASINTEHWRQRGFFYERYMFYLAPLFFAGFVGSFERISARAVAVSTAVATVLLLLMPSGVFRAPLSLDAFGQAYLVSMLGDDPAQLKLVGFVLAGLAVVMGAALALATLPKEHELARIGRLLAVVLPAFLLVVSQAKAWSYQQIFTGDLRAAAPKPIDWVERAADAPVAMLVADGADQTTMYMTEFWNPSIVRVFTSSEVPISSPKVTSPHCPLLLSERGQILSTKDPGCALTPRTWVVDSPTVAIRLRGASLPIAPEQAHGFTLQTTSVDPRILSILGGRTIDTGLVISVLAARTFARPEARLRTVWKAKDRDVRLRLPNGKTVEIPGGRSSTIVLPVGEGDQLTRIAVESGTPKVTRVELREGDGPWQRLD